MILLDLNQVMFSSLFASVGKHTNVAIEEDLLRHMIINIIRNINVDFRKDYGELVIAADSKHYWRKDIFPYYKASRKASREASDMDWETVFACFNSIKNDLKEFFPYKFIEVLGAEADDVIGAIVHIYCSNSEEKHLIVSGDKDYKQLQIFPNVSQYDPIRKKFIHSLYPQDELMEHILRGDSGDGIPNVLSDGNSFVINKRQKPLTKKILATLDNVQKDCTHKYYDNYLRNRELIDFSYIPKELVNSILAEFEKKITVDKVKLMMYFASKNLKTMMTKLNDF